MTLIHAFLLIVLFLVLLTMELFIPSGGLLGIAAGAALLAAIVIGFMHSLQAGAAILFGAAFIVPVLISIGLRAWPKTALGKKMLTLDPTQNAIDDAQWRSAREALVGKIGVAKTDMLPSGLIEIDGVKIDAISVGMAIERGQSVKVVSVNVGKVQVSPVTVREESEPRNIVPDSLETPIESLGLDD
jgi:membrane-bound ClpP family serine protease